MVSEPIVKLDENGKATILSYNVPEPTSYTGRNMIELDIPTAYFKKDISFISKYAQRSTTPPIIDVPTGPETNPTALRAAVIEGMKSGFSSTKIFSNGRNYAGTLRFVEKPDLGFQLESNDRISSKLAKLQPDEVVASVRAGMSLNIYRNMYGNLTYNYIRSSGPDIPNDSDPKEKKPPLDKGRFFISIISPESGDTIVGTGAGAKIDITGRSGSLTFATRVQSVEVQIGSSGTFKPAVPKAAGDWSSWTFSDTTTLRGSVTIIAKATYPNGVTRGDGITVQVISTITQPPSINITSPSDGQAIQSPSIGTRLRIEGTASGADSGVQSVEVQIGSSGTFKPAFLGISAPFCS